MDTTLGGGGHSFAVLEATQPSGVLIGCDRDVDAVNEARRRLASFGPSARLHHAHHSEIKRIVAEEGYEAVDAVLFDLGLSSIQLDTPGRGFRIDSADSLDMRMDQTGGPTAADLVNGLPEKELANLIYEFGEERKSRAIARAIGRARARKPLERCDELSAVVVSAVAGSGGGKRGRWRIHPATRTFQALRMAVNSELENLRLGLEQAIQALGVVGRLAVISYHSLEDRLVKNTLRREAADCVCPPRTPVCACGHSASVRLVHRRVIKPTPQEIAANPRSRSARLRTAERS